MPHSLSAGTLLPYYDARNARKDCNSVLTAIVAEHLVGVEVEGMVDGVIKGENRDRGVELTLMVEERRARVRYARLQKGPFVRPHQGRWSG
jgi:hypothetical protein